MVDEIRKGQDRPSSSGWQCPPSGRLKLNSDAAVFPDGSVGLGFVVRNYEGVVLLAGSKRLTAAADHSVLIEALALQQLKQLIS